MTGPKYDNEDLQWVLFRLWNAKRVGDAWTAACPAHEDASPSLTVSLEQNGKVRMHCHKGCTTADVVGALNKRKPDSPPDMSRSNTIDRFRMHAFFARDENDGPEVEPPPWETRSKEDKMGWCQAIDSCLDDGFSTLSRVAVYEYHRGEADGLAWATAAKLKPNDVSIPPNLLTEDYLDIAVRISHDLEWAYGAQAGWGHRL